VSEPSFESQLAALYRETPPAHDERAFLAKVDAELSRQLHRRRLVLTLLGGVGGAVSLAAIVQLEATAGLRERLASALHTLASVEWGFATSAALIVSLLVPVFMRAVIDPR
jgi:hypothetical protein